jgi:MFS family permease
MTVETSGATSYRQLFGQPGFPQLAAGTVLARTANVLWQVALVLFVLQQFHSPVLAGVASFLSIAPGLAVSPIAGALLDRQGRLRMILLDYGVAATSLVLLFALSAAHLLSPAVLLPIVAIGSLTGPLSASGSRTLFPLVVPRALWDRANAVDSGSQALATVLGPALAGLLVAWVGGGGAFLATAVIFALAALAIVGITDPHTSQGTPAPLLRASREALVYVLRHATLRGIIFTFFVGNIGFGILTVALPVLVFARFHWGAAAVGALWSLGGVATVIASVIVGRVNSEGRERRMVALGMGLAAAGCAMLALAHAAPLLLAAMIILGLSGGPIDIGMFSLRQRRTDPRWFGRAFAVSMGLNYAGAPVGSALAGPIVERSVLLALAIAAVFSLAAGIVPLVLIPRER